MSMAAKTAKKIIHMLGVNLRGDYKVERALRAIPGISFMTARAIRIVAGIDKDKKLADLSEEELKRLEEIIKNPPIPAWLKNRRRDPRTGEDLHLVGADVKLKMQEDINFLKKIRCWRGIRHELGLKVRGQRLHSSWRRTKVTIGVQRKKKK